MVSGFALRVAGCVVAAANLNAKPATRNTKPTSGFTLVELLVVIVILGIVLALVGLNLMPDDKRTVRNEAQRLALLLEQARDEAVLGGEVIAWSAQDGGYRFWHKDEAAQWEPLKQDELWRERQFASGVELRALYINKKLVPLNERLSFSPAGIGMPFEIDLALNQAHVVISGDAQGKLSLQEAG